MSKYENLPAQIEARNRVNAEANRLADEIGRLLTPWVGRKALTADGKWVKAGGLNTVMSNLTPAGFRLWFDIGPVSIWAHLDTRYQVGEVGCDYVKKAFWVGDIANGGILTAVRSEPLNARTDYDLGQVKATAARIRELEAEFSALKFGLSEIKGW